MATRQERMRERMRGAGRHNVGDVDFGFIIPVAEEAADDLLEEAPVVDESPRSPVPTTTTTTTTATRPTPNTSAKRKYLNRDAFGSNLLPPPPPAAPSAAASDIYSLRDDSTQAGSTVHAPTPAAPEDEDHAQDVAAEEDEDQPMTDAPPISSVPPSTRQLRSGQPKQQQRGPLSSIISATKRLAFDPSSSPPSTRTQTAQQPTYPEEMEVTESPADAPGSGRRRPLSRIGAGTPVVESSALLQKVLEDLDGESSMDMEHSHLGMGNSSPIERRVATRRSGELRRAQRARMSAESASGSAATGGVGGRGGGGAQKGSSSPTGAMRRRRRSARLSVEGSSSGGSSVVAESEVVAEKEPAGAELSMVVEEEGVEELSVVEEEAAEEATDPSAEDENVEDGEVQRQQEGRELEQGEQEEEEAQEVGEEETAQRLGRKRPRRSLRAPSPELGSSLTGGSPASKRRRRGEPASPAQQQQPAKKPRRGRPPPRPQPPPTLQPQPQPDHEPEDQDDPRPHRSQTQPQTQRQAKPKAKPRKQAKKKRASNEEDGEEKESGSVAVTVQRFTKPRIAGYTADGEREPGGDLLNGEIPFANPGGVNAVDVLSKLCEELVETYMAKLEERGRAAEDAATRREQKTMYRALEAFHEEVKTRLLEHTIALDTLHALGKRVRAAQKEKLALRDEILRIRREREQVALRMDAIRIRHEADSKEALRHISLSSAMHDIDMAVEKGQAAPELSPAEQKKADLANLELLISQVADQACTRSDGGGALKQIKEFNAFLERTAAVLERR
ncbi:uncharacterized protein B0T15DRAFT_19964 [Chaetomium strumarium]|uniref:Inner kinetochore subunit AME1 domain-containing protein n=1 Tax=Chaetomium strumarium TaxID=1170767 RepID=A0AAJ0M5M3_9PEZI|nr:hypothetical protein B0T15DRAFT_19964 [Chaetomium strumarium]